MVWAACLAWAGWDSELTDTPSSNSRRYSSIEERKAARGAFLSTLYDTVDGRARGRTNISNIATKLTISIDDAADIMQYLAEEGLAEHVYIGGGIGITHYGIKEVEQLRSAPDVATEHFPSGAVINQFIDHGSINSSAIAFQDSTASVIENPGFTQQLTEISDLVAQLLATTEANTDVARLLEELRGDILDERDGNQSVPGRLQGTLSSLKNICEGITGNVAAAMLLRVVPPMLEQIN